MEGPRGREKQGVPTYKALKDRLRRKETVKITGREIMRHLGKEKKIHFKVIMKTNTEFSATVEIL